MANEKKETKVDGAGAGSIVVRRPAAGRWRGGKHFTAEPQTLDLSKLTRDELAAIESDPVLSISRVN